ncbi:mitogen-activated protein kinase kinase kinase 19 isoform X2 [Cyprinodon tularosa]|uniref:mitogen-activated protein kinase kinase kinase 19 isoform X2 n=1 Tax=Cyprinodon tularosa TaxID=77115 RepID=UPI0018E2066E|nr:mitogen-activated protein kinase kinase kinase 19 isoform X2 [Cyprinodon tularosa]
MSWLTFVKNESKTDVVQGLLRADADLTLCNHREQTALHISPAVLQEKMVRWMKRPHLSPQMQLLQAAWQGDLGSVRQLLTQTDGVDVNIPNSDGVTAVMLAVRDVDLFEGMATWLPWEHNPVEVVKELLKFSAEVRARDHNGYSALHYAANLSSHLMEEIIPVLIEALSHTEVDPKSSSTFEKYSFQDAHHAYSDPEQRDHQTRSSQHSDHSQSHIKTFLQTPGSSPQFDKKDFSQAHKGIPTCSQNTMETLKHIGRANQDVRRGNRGLCLPSLSNTNRQCDHTETFLSSGFLSSRTPCQPVPPRQRQRTRSVVEASPPSHSLLHVSESSQLSQSAPSIMEPLLCPTLMQARVHIQTRLNSQNSLNDQKGSVPALYSRTPKLLVPLDGRPRDPNALPSLKPHVPLKPINRSPLRTKRKLRKGGLSLCSVWNGLSNAGSEESGSSSSSSQSSINLENEDNDGQIQEETANREENLKFVKDEELQQSDGRNLSEADLSENTMFHPNIKGRICSMVNRSQHDGERDYLHSTKHVRIENAESEANTTNHPKEALNSKKEETLTLGEFENNKQCERYFLTEDKRDMSCMAEYKTAVSKEITYNERDLQHDPHGCSEENNGNEQIKSDHNEPMRNDLFDQEAKATKRRACSAATAVEKTGFFPVDPKEYEMMFKARNKESKTRMNCHLKANNSTIHSPNKDPSMSGGNHSKVTLSTEVKVKSKKIPDISREPPLAKAKLNFKVDNAACLNSGTQTLHNVGDFPHSYKTHQQTSVRELKKTQQFKKPCLGGENTRSKSAVDLITYRDMFQQIQSGEEGPAMYEMFAGPFFENLQVSRSSEKLKERQLQSMPSRKTKQSHEAKHKPTQKKPKTNSGESTAALIKIRPKPRSAQMTPRSTNDSCRAQSNPKVEKATPQEFSHKPFMGESENPILSTIVETLSKDGSERLSPGNKSPAGSPTPLYGVDSRLMGNPTTSSVTSMANLAEQDPELNQSLSPQQAMIDPSTSSGSSCHTLMSPVYKKFLEEVGEGPLTDDLLQCLAEELISLDERDVPTAHENSEPGKSVFHVEEELLSGQKTFPEVASADSNSYLGSELVANDTITWAKGEVLGKGAYGTVYCGLTSQGQLIAVKQVCLDLSDPNAANKEYNRLQGEVELLKTLRHSNIVGFLGTSLYQHVVSIFMEYIPGGSIASVLHRFGPLPERVLALYTHQILEGVAFLHQNRVIHRDLKGNNVMLMPTGVIKLIDFGCARRLSCLNQTAPSSGELLKSIHGTPYWMAPEVINESGYGRKSDIWSVGCTVFEMATGKPPLAHMDKMAALFYIGARRGLMPSLPDSFSENAKDFVQICLTRDQSLRPSAAQLLRHSFIPKRQTNIKYCETQKNNCSHGHRVPPYQDPCHGCVFSRDVPNPNSKEPSSSRTPLDSKTIQEA